MRRTPTIPMLALLAAAIIFAPAAGAEINPANTLSSGNQPAGGGPMTIATGAEDAGAVV